MQLSPVRPSHAPQVQRIKAKPWPFLASPPGQIEGDLMAHAKRVIAKTKAHLMEPGKQ